jgi:hypothetical protein
MGVETCSPAGAWSAPVACPASAPLCSQGQCSCPSNDVMSNGVCCPPGETGCAGACAKTQTDPSNCGACERACFACSNGVCQVPTAISAGVGACALMPDGTVECWGFSASTGQGAPTPVAGVTGATAIGVGGFASTFACAVVGADSHVVCWGDNEFGELGDNTTSTMPSTAPVMVTGLKGATALAVGPQYACALAGGTVACWGLDAQGQYGDPAQTNLDCFCEQTPITVPGLTGISAAAAGAWDTCFLGGGSVQCMGVDFEDTGTPTPFAFPPASAITAGNTFACALLADASGVECWGDDPQNHLGIGGTPSLVPGLTSVGAIAAGTDGHVCALLKDGTVQCWGSSAKAVSMTPVAVSGISGAKAIAAGSGFNCALLSTGAVHCWQQ